MKKILNSEKWNRAWLDLVLLSHGWYVIINVCMIRWICNTRALDRVPSSELLAKLGIVGITLLLRAHRLRWFGHIQRVLTCIKTVCDLPVSGRRRCGRPMKSWMICVEKDIKDCNLSQVNPMNRVDWRRASRLPPTPAAGTQTAV